MPRRSWLTRQWSLYRVWRTETKRIRLALERIAEALDRMNPPLSTRRAKSLSAEAHTNREAAAWDLTERSLTTLMGRRPSEQEILDRLEEAESYLDLRRSLGPRS